MRSFSLDIFGTKKNNNNRTNEHALNYKTENDNNTLLNEARKTIIKSNKYKYSEKVDLSW